MELLAKLTLRNNCMVAWRAARGYTQRQAAVAVGISPWVWMRLERLEYPANFPETRIISMAVNMDVKPEDIMTPELASHKTQSITKTVEVSTEMLLESGHVHNFILPSPEDVTETKDAAEHILEEHFQYLTEIESSVLKQRFGLDGEVPRTHLEVGQVRGISGERVRQIERSAIRKLKHRQEIEQRAEDARNYNL